MRTILQNAKWFDSAHHKWYLLGALFGANLFIWHAIFAETRNGILTVVRFHSP